MTRRIKSIVALLALLLTMCAVCISCKGKDSEVDVPNSESTENKGDNTTDTGDGVNTGENETEDGYKTEDESENGNDKQPEDTQKYGEFHFGFQ